MKERIVARRYARGVLLLARESGQVERLERDVENLRRALSAVPALMRCLTDERIGLDRRTGVAAAVAQELKLSAYARDLVLLLLCKQRIRLLPLVAEEAAAMVLQERRLATARARVASKVEVEEVRERIESILTLHLAVEVRCEVEVEPRLLGGFEVLIGDVRFDASIAGRMQRLQEELLAEAAKD